MRVWGRRATRSTPADPGSESEAAVGPEGPSTRETSIETETTASTDEASVDRATSDDPTAAEAVARSAATFDATDTGQIPNGTGRWNAYTGSCHGSE